MRGRYFAGGSSSNDAAILHNSPKRSLALALAFGAALAALFATRLADAKQSQVDRSSRSAWFITKTKDAMGAPEVSAFLVPWLDEPEKATSPTSSLISVGCKAGNLTVALVSDVGVSGEFHDIFVRRDEGSERKEIWAVERMLPGIWKTAEAGRFLDSLASLHSLSIRYEANDGSWSRKSKYRMNNYDEAMRELKVACPW
ncbi:hypothetical protein [Mesorhizobium sp. NZP2298]|uniref:hypothetical protein n=1 Tax=Mesorhizobium sp. NZP2298 TaxID=2483403 RepID=UPI001552EE0C|nr:hypothetical protein [Mesorhizobium sp. NZP2298]QKC95664.1 hypothetical protein EB231_13725 [Mesorhizobium sp. NZP2298]